MKSKKFNIILISLKNTIIPIILCSFMIFLILFSTSKGEVYIKTEGGKKKLDAYGIQEELRGRLEGF